MAAEVIMPKIDENMQEGTIVQWMKKEGDRVTKGETLFVIETEKVTWEVQAEASGILGKPLVGIEEAVSVGSTVVFILEPGEKPPDIEKIRDTNEKAKTVSHENKKAAMKSPKGEKGSAKLTVKASPLAKKTAREHGIDIATIQGSGADGSITEEDVLKAINK
jgi:pyruvate dehydrogenase E2 component (dihydrolipoamide acetyltransferase)